MINQTDLDSLGGCTTCGLPRSYYGCDTAGCKVPAGVGQSQIAAFIVKRRCLLEHEAEVLRRRLESCWPGLPLKDQQRMRDEDQASRAMVQGYWKGRV